MFADFGIAFDREAYRRTYSADWYYTFRCVGLPEERWTMADERWLAYFAEETYTLLDGVHDLLRSLAARGVVAGIVTSGSRPRIERELARHGVDRHFRDVRFGTDTERRKPPPPPPHPRPPRLGLAPPRAADGRHSPRGGLVAEAAG